ncbi:hypothetical protein [Sulfuricurvum sp.]|uniref:hypothetical protein n=1 Tax=Sulfuricurvum sp. TaxID=2025608 RepID=UPI00260960F1|nr:hypothetical protein [Sulfuricurvum sp.]MDD2266686.1 hypothetical protein [Sulfuricurvum sp.]MDD2784134.1 hypothetical protein [Sulfuricurvum sp.]
MYRHTTPTKRFLASALLTTGLLGVVPLIGDDLIQPEGIQTIQEQVSRRIDSQLCNKQFQCSKTGLVIQFLPNAKALFMHPDSEQMLKADYTVHFNRHIAMNVYENPSKNFDLMMHDVMMHPEGFVANVNREDRYFQKV